MLTMQKGANGHSRLFCWTGIRCLALRVARKLLPGVGLRQHFLQVGHVCLDLVRRKVFTGNLPGLFKAPLQANDQGKVLPKPWQRLALRQGHGAAQGFLRLL